MVKSLIECEISYKGNHTKGIGKSLNFFLIISEFNNLTVASSFQIKFLN